MATVAIVGFEGVRYAAYLDTTGTPTICMGDTHGVKLGDIATPQECDARTKREVERALQTVNASVDYELPDPVQVALASFVYNAGAGNYRGSTLLKLLRARDIAGACRQLPRWIYSRGIKLGGLVNRRNAEMKICLEGA